MSGPSDANEEMMLSGMLACFDPNTEPGTGTRSGKEGNVEVPMLLLYPSAPICARRDDRGADRRRLRSSGAVESEIVEM